MKIKKKYIAFFTLAFIICYSFISFYTQYKDQQEKDRLFCENCKSTDIIHFRDGFIEIYFYKDPVNKYVEHFNILHIRNGSIIDTIKFTEGFSKKYGEYNIQQFDLKTYDTLQIKFSESKKINIYGFKNEIEYRNPNKIIDCNFQS